MAKVSLLPIFDVCRALFSIVISMVMLAAFPQLKQFILKRISDSYFSFKELKLYAPTHF
jgi:hypothetical protein